MVQTPKPSSMLKFYPSKSFKWRKNQFILSFHLFSNDWTFSVDKRKEEMEEITICFLKKKQEEKQIFIFLPTDRLKWEC